MYLDMITGELSHSVMCLWAQTQVLLLLQLLLLSILFIAQDNRSLIYASINLQWDRVNLEPP